MLSTYEFGLLKQLEKSYPNYYDTDALDISDLTRDTYIKAMLNLEHRGLVESGLIEASTSYVISNPKITTRGVNFLASLNN